jgi:hypothetical protein
MEELDLGGDLTYSERPIKILDMEERTTHSKSIKMCKVQWSHHTEDEATWSTKKSSEQITQRYFQVLPESQWRDSSKEGRFVALAFCIITSSPS